MFVCMNATLNLIYEFKMSFLGLSGVLRHKRSKKAFSFDFYRLVVAELMCFISQSSYAYCGLYLHVV